MPKNIKIECWWTSCANITKRTIDQFCFNGNMNDINFVTNDDYEWLVVCGKLPDNYDISKINRSKTIFFVMEPSWSPNTDKNASDYSKYICTHNKAIFNNQNSIFFEEPNYMFYGGRGDDGWNINNINSMIFEKNKKCSMIVTKRGNIWNAKNLYDKRVKLSEALVSYNDVDIYGTFWDNKYSNTHGEIWNKFVGLSNYKFSIAIENTSENNYITEKFYDCILTNTIPIYYGSPNISEYFDPMGFIQLPDLEGTEKCVDIIKNLCVNYDEEYENRKNACLSNKNVFLNNYNIINKIKNIIYNE